MNMKHLIALILFSGLALNLSGQAEQNESNAIAKKVEGLTLYDGYFQYYWDEKAGKIWLEIDQFDEEFLYVNSLRAGVGSNDIGLDRNQLGGEHVVKFIRVGPQVLLQKPNQDYRAISDNQDEVNSVAEAFASSVLLVLK